MFTVQVGTTALAAFRASFEYHISDHSFTARRLSERAFIHLERTIMVDESARLRWQTAFNDREEAVERLGAVHLLQHGIWAFKADAVGGRTDLVLGEPLTDLARAECAAEALVLVSEKAIEVPADREYEGATHHFVNVAVDPTYHRAAHARHSEVPDGQPN